MRKKNKGRGQQDYYDQGQYYGQPDNYDQGQYTGQQGYYNQGQYNASQGNYGQGQYNDQQGYYGQGQYTGQQGYYDQGQYNDPQGYNGQRPYNDQQGYYRQSEYGGQPGNYEQRQYSKRPAKRSGKKKHRKALFILEVIVLLILAGGLFAAVQLGRMDRVKLKDIMVNTGITKSGYRNIALFGVDSREGELESGTNSDTIMVASINEKTGDVKLVSVYRDTYLDNTNGKYSKANESFAGGGAERAVNMLNKNLDLDIKDFATVDFNGVIKAVDLLGGIELDITEEERGWLNGYLVETSQVTGVPYDEVPSAGTQTVTGIQAMAYCRIRYTEGWDYKRTERQRIVLEKLFAKAKAQGVTGLVSLVNSMMDYISTSLSNTEILALAANVANYNIADTVGFPFEKQAADIAAGDCVVPVNLAANVTELHKRLFGVEDYTPSDTVQEISYQITMDTGIG